MKVKTSVRAGWEILATNRGIGKNTPIESIQSHGESFATQRDLHSGLADSSIELSLYGLEKQEIVAKRYRPIGQHINTFA